MEDHAVITVDVGDRIRTRDGAEAVVTVANDQELKARFLEGERDTGAHEIMRVWKAKSYEIVWARHKEVALSHVFADSRDYATARGAFCRKVAEFYPFVTLKFTRADGGRVTLATWDITGHDPIVAGTEIVR